MRAFHGGLVDAHVGERLLVGGLGVFEFLLADRADVHQILKALHLQARGSHVGFGSGEIGLRAVEIGLIGGGIDLIEDIPGLDVRAFLKETLLDDAAHLRTHFSDLETRRAAGKFRRIQHLLRGHDLHGHFHGGNRRGLGPRLFVLAAHEGQAAEKPGQQSHTGRAAVHASPTYNLTLRLSARFNHHAPIENTSDLRSPQVACIV